MINLFKNTNPQTTPDSKSLKPESLSHIDHYIPPDIILSQIWLILSKKWRKHCSWRLGFLELHHKNFSDGDYRKFLTDFLHLCKSYKIDELKKFEFRFEEYWNHHRLTTNFRVLGSLFKEAFPYLETLSLSFVGLRGPISQDMHSLMMVIGRELCHLSKLSLSFESSLLNDACLKMFNSKNTGYNLKLDSLELNLAQCLQISNLGFVGLFKEITRAFNKLKALNLNLSKTCINDTSLDKLMRLTNQRLAHLEVLKLDFTGCKNIWGRGLSPFGQKDSKQGPQLRKISMIFDDCTDFYDEGLYAVGNLVQKNRNTLKALHISLNRCKGVTERAFKVFSDKYLKDLDNLKKIELDLGMCSKITDEVLEGLALRLGSLGRLEKLKLSLFACNGITDRGVKVLRDEIKKRLVNLKDLQLDFLYTNFVTKEVLNDLLAVFGGLARVNITFI